MFNTVPAMIWSVRSPIDIAASIQPIASPVATPATTPAASDPATDATVNAANADIRNCPSIPMFTMPERSPIIPHMAPSTSRVAARTVPDNTAVVCAPFQA